MVMDACSIPNSFIFPNLRQRLHWFMNVGSIDFLHFINNVPSSPLRLTCFPLVVAFFVIIPFFLPGLVNRTREYDDLRDAYPRNSFRSPGQNYLPLNLALAAACSFSPPALYTTPQFSSGAMSYALYTTLQYLLLMKHPHVISCIPRCPTFQACGRCSCGVVESEPLDLYLIKALAGSNPPCQKQGTPHAKPDMLGIWILWGTLRWKLSRQIFPEFLWFQLLWGSALCKIQILSSQTFRTIRLAQNFCRTGRLPFCTGSPDLRCRRGFHY